MGAWDFGPFDNDDASAFWYDIHDAKNPVKTLKKYLNNNSPGCQSERRAAAAFVEFLSRFDRRIMATLKNDAKKALKELLEDDDFVYDWKDPERVKKLLKKELKSLK